MKCVSLVSFVIIPTITVGECIVGGGREPTIFCEDKDTGNVQATDAYCIETSTKTCYVKGYSLDSAGLFSSRDHAIIAKFDFKKGVYREEGFKPEEMATFCLSRDTQSLEPVESCPCETSDQAFLVAFYMVQKKMLERPTIEHSSGVYRKSRNGSEQWYPIQTESSRDNANSVVVSTGASTVLNMHYHPDQNRAHPSWGDVIAAYRSGVPGFILVRGNDGSLSRSILGYSKNGRYARFALLNGRLEQQSDWKTAEDLCTDEERETGLDFNAELNKCSVSSAVAECLKRLERNPYCSSEEVSSDIRLPEEGHKRGFVARQPSDGSETVSRQSTSSSSSSSGTPDFHIPILNSWSEP